MLRQQTRDDPREQVAASALGHSWIAACVHRDASIRMRDQCPRSFQYEGDAQTLRKGARDIEPIALYLGD